MSDITLINFISQAKLKVRQIQMAPSEHQKLLIMDLFEFVDSYKCKSANEEALDRILDTSGLTPAFGYLKVLLSKIEKLETFNDKRNSNTSHRSSDHSKSVNPETRLSPAKISSIKKSSFVSENILKIMESVCEQLKSVIKEINTSLSLFSHKTKFNDSNFFAIQYYLIDIEVQSRFLFSQPNKYKEENKSEYLLLRHKVINTFAPLLESYLKIGLKPQTKNRVSCPVEFVWELVLDYFKYMDGDQIVNEPIMLLVATYGSNVIDIKEDYNERDFLLFLIKQVTKLKTSSKSDLFSRFVLEGVLRGKLALWMKMIWLEWAEIIYFYEKGSFALSAGTEKFIASISNVLNIKMDINYYF